MAPHLKRWITACTAGAVLSLLDLQSNLWPIVLAIGGAMWGAVMLAGWSLGMALRWSAMKLLPHRNR